MNSFLIFSIPPAQIDCNVQEQAATATAATPELSASYSLLIVMLIYVLFGAAGFFAAAQLI